MAVGEDVRNTGTGLMLDRLKWVGGMHLGEPGWFLAGSTESRGLFPDLEETREE